jgi:hypothetical protein
MRPLGECQLGVLKAMAEYDGWHWHVGWLWGSVSQTRRICESLVARRLATKTPYDHGFRYDLTDEGKPHVPEGFGKRCLFRREHRGRFGEPGMDRRMEIRNKLIANGLSPHDPDLHDKVDDAYRTWLATAPAEEPQQAVQKAPQPAPVFPLSFSPDELERLVERFAGANDPISLSIHDKAQATLVRSSH